MANSALPESNNMITSSGHTMYLGLHAQPLTKKQRRLVAKNEGSLVSIMKGVKNAIAECKHQFKHKKWDCPTFDARHGKAIFGQLLTKACKETAFVYAITSAGVTHEVARACSKGSIRTCGCDTRYPNYQQNHPVLSDNDLHLPNAEIDPKESEGGALEFKNDIGIDTPGGDNNNWRWGGCSDNVKFGRRFARKFVNSAEMDSDLRYLVNSHNNAAGRGAVTRSMTKFCKCQGLSGSCNLKTCWMRVTPFRNIGNTLRLKYDKAAKVVSNNNVQSFPNSNDNYQKINSFNPESYKTHKSAYEADKIERLTTNINKGNRESREDRYNDIDADRNDNGAVDGGNNDEVKYFSDFARPLSSPFYAFKPRRKSLFERDVPSLNIVPPNSVSVPPKTSFNSLNSLQDMVVGYDTKRKRANKLGMDAKESRRGRRKKSRISKQRLLRQNNSSYSSQLSIINGEDYFHLDRFRHSALVPDRLDLVYYEESPDFCEYDPKSSSRGTRNRQCTLNSRSIFDSNLYIQNLNSNRPLNSFSMGFQMGEGLGNCETICCERGYTSREVLVIQRCNCTFQWCCNVKCQECAFKRIIYTCL
ncbi:unnamed protein product [Gordionus sp. m RMFG-2023]|uniref:proto-oncogene Wnt-1-like n=1 Tax=Gordionus sp. m RMFG-2023 TaxID=3053472 RepID=UPI0030E1956C